jgi:hypothetical protein
MNPVDELLKAFELVKEYDKSRTPQIKEYRLYYHSDGTILGLWENGFPEGTNYITIGHPDIFHKHNTNWLRVVNGELKIIHPDQNRKVKLAKSHIGWRTVKSHAALLLDDNEIFDSIEYYEQKNS